MSWQAWTCWVLIAVAVLANLLCVVIFGWDKWLSRRSGRLKKEKKPITRISEKSLLGWTMIAPFGSILGMWIWHHKVNKWSFKWRAMIVCLIGFCIYAAIAYGVYRWLGL